ncbi:alkaline phosphatase family protein [Chitinophaga caeni]|uniref:Alkaline phosphatase family protein n=2 Tax=Chitinophaga caeni TaxID=2029983 RepID=A0A291R095_9BACT|nr:alkaline phosphatase family protein [Chitinophaga caeni]
MKKTTVIDVVGLSSSLIGEHTPFLKQYVAQHGLSTIKPMFPAVTTSVQSTYLTGKLPNEHGIVGNGWYDRTDCEVKFWKQSNRLVESEKLYEKAKQADPLFTCAKMFWWYNMYADVDFSVTPRPNYLSDGRKLPDCYSHPASLRDSLQKELGQFPLFNFWGPNANIKSSKWIADASIMVDRWHHPTLQLIYLPHLDYCLQKFGQDLSKISKELNEIDSLVEELVRYFESEGSRVIILSEYGITNVSKPIHLNRIFRQQGWIAIREERGLELLDAGASKVFAVADHQVAHVYVNDASIINQAREVLESVPGLELILNREGKRDYFMQHERSGDFVLMADKDSWFTYYYWMDDAKAPDFARIVDIHRKPGYDPVEMFTDPEDKLVMLKVAWKLLKKKLGFRYLMDVIPLDATLVKGSHGRVTTDKDYHPVFISNFEAANKELEAVDIYSLIWNHLNS